MSSEKSHAGFTQQSGGPKATEWQSIPALGKAEEGKPAGATEGDTKAVPNLASKVALWQGDITKLRIDCIVAAANEALAGCFARGHCIDAAIHLAAGPGLIAECKRLYNGCPTGEAKLTGGHRLPCKYIIHTTGPRVNEEQDLEEDPEMLAQCYTRTLDLAKQQGGTIRSLAFCCISTGIFGFRKEPAAHIALKTVRDWLVKSDENFKAMDRVVFDIWTDEDLAIYQRLAPQYFSPLAKPVDKATAGAGGASGPAGAAGASPDQSQGVAGKN